MMEQPIFFRDSSTAVSATPATPGSVTIPRPVSVVAGDFMLAMIAVTGTRSLQFSPPDGWMPLDRYVDTAFWNVGFWYYKFAGDADPASYTWQGDGYILGFVAGISAYAKVNRDNPIHTWLSYGGGMPREMTTTRDSHIVWFSSADWPETISNLRPSSGDDDIVDRWGATSQDNCGISGDAFRVAGTQEAIVYDLDAGNNQSFNPWAPSLTVALLPVVVTPVPTQVAITPTTATLSRREVLQFITNQPVDWSLSGPGSLSLAGLYFAPRGKIKRQTAAIVTATALDGSSKATASVTLRAG